MNPNNQNNLLNIYAVNLATIKRYLKHLGYTWDIRQTDDEVTLIVFDHELAEDRFHGKDENEAFKKA